MVSQVRKVALPLPEPNTQSQVDALPQHVSIPLPQHQPIDPTGIVQPIGPKIQHRPSPPYQDPYSRPYPRPPDVIDSIDSWKDLSDIQFRQECRYRRKFSISGRYKFRNI